MIDSTTFQRWMAVMGERVGKEASADLFAVMYASCSAKLTTEQFVRGIQHVIAHHRYNTWPAAALIIEAGIRAVPVEVQAAAAWEQLLPLAYGLAPNAPSWSKVTYPQLEERCGRAAVLTFRAAGGYERLGSASKEDLQWMRKDFAEQYGTFLAFADEEPNYDVTKLPAAVRSLVAETAKKLSISAAATAAMGPLPEAEPGKLTEIPDWRSAMGARPLREEVSS